MKVIAAARWRRLDVRGEDEARVVDDGGLRLDGAAAFAHQDGEARLRYLLEFDSQWRTVRARIAGTIMDTEVTVLIERNELGWRMNGEDVGGLSNLVDLDLGFTPATNYQQLRRMNLDVGQSSDCFVAWWDVGAATLVELKQHYRRVTEFAYEYAAPSVGYEATLRVAANGFVAEYPELWEMQTRER